MPGGRTKKRSYRVNQREMAVGGGAVGQGESGSSDGIRTNIKNYWSAYLNTPLQRQHLMLMIFVILVLEIICEDY